MEWINIAYYIGGLLAGAIIFSIISAYLYKLALQDLIQLILPALIINGDNDTDFIVIDYTGTMVASNDPENPKLMYKPGTIQERDQKKQEEKKEAHHYGVM